MKSSEKMIGKIGAIIKSPKYTKLLLICGVVGILLIMLSSFDIPGKVKTAEKEDDFAEKAEKQIGSIVCRITGEKSVGVMVSLDSTGEVVYADAKSISKNNKTDNQSENKFKTEQTDDTEQNYIIIEKADGGEEALVVSKLSPTVRGVVVVTKFADNSAVSQRIVEAVTTVLNIPEKKVCVVAGK